MQFKKLSAAKAPLMCDESTIQMAQCMSPHTYTCVNRAMQHVQRHFSRCDLAPCAAFLFLQAARALPTRERISLLRFCRILPSAIVSITTIAISTLSRIFARPRIK